MHFKSTTVYPSPMTYKSLLPLVLLLCAAAFFFYVDQPSRVMFSTDETITMWQLEHMVHDGELPLSGKYVGHTKAKLGPLHYYLTAPFFYFHQAPETLVVLNALWAALGIAVLWITGASFFSLPTAWIAALFSCLHVVLIFYTRSILHYAYVPAFSSFLLALCLLFLRQPRAGLLFPIGLIYGSLIQFHFLPTVFIGAIVFLFTRLPGKRMNAVGYFLSGACLPMAPWLYSELSNGFPQIIALFQPAGMETPSLSVAAFAFWLLFEPSGSYVHHITSQGDALSAGIRCLFAVLSVVSGASILIYSLKRKAGPFLSFLLIWAACPLFAALVLPLHLHGYYLLGLFPAFFLLFARGLSLSLESAGRRIRAFLYAILAIFFVLLLVHYQFNFGRCKGVNKFLDLEAQREAVSFAASRSPEKLFVCSKFETEVALRYLIHRDPIRAPVPGRLGYVINADYLSDSDVTGLTPLRSWADQFAYYESDSGSLNEQIRLPCVRIDTGPDVYKQDSEADVIRFH